MKPQFLLSVFLFLFPSFVHAQNVYEFHPSVPLRIGVGVDPADPTTTHRTALSFTVKRDDTGATTSIVASQVKSLAQFNDAMSLDANVDADFLFGGVGAKLDYANEQWFDSSSFTFSIRADVDYGLWEMTNPQLTAEATALKSNANQFHREFGSSYIDSERRAALVVAVFSVSNVSDSLRTTLANSLNASVFSDFSATATESYKHTLETALKVSTVSYQFFSRGGPGIATQSGVITNLDDFSKVLKSIQDYVNSVTPDTSLPIEFYARSYGDWGITADSVSPINEEALRQDYYAYQNYSALLAQVQEYLAGEAGRYAYFSQAQFFPLLQAEPELQSLLNQVLVHAQSVKAQRVNDGAANGAAVEVKFWPVISIPFPHITMQVLNLERRPGPGEIQVPWLSEGIVTGTSVGSVQQVIRGNVVTSWALVPYPPIPDAKRYLVPLNTVPGTGPTWQIFDHQVIELRAADGTVLASVHVTN